MAKVTLIGKDLAQKNNEFIFHGPLQECKECKLTHICFNLKPFHRYTVSKIRKKHHICNVHQGNAVVVEVKQQPFQVALEKKYTKGSTVTIDEIYCNQKLCTYYDICTSKALKPNHKYKITSIIKDVKCPKNKSLQIVEVTE